MDIHIIPDATYDKHHQYDCCGTTLVPPPPLADTVTIDATNGTNANASAETEELMVTVLRDHPAKTQQGAMRGRKEKTRQSMKSVYAAAGIHQPVLPSDLGMLPRRFEAGSVKARMTWFGTLCIAGIGMFVEAYIIITTGQLKSIWHAMYPTCWSPEMNMACPDLIKCCGLFPNTPLDASTGQCAVEDFDTLVEGNMYEVCDPSTGDYRAGSLCNENILDAISYSEFAGVRIYSDRQMLLCKLYIIGDTYTFYACGVGVFIILFVVLTLSIRWILTSLSFLFCFRWIIFVSPGNVLHTIHIHTSIHPCCV